MVHLADNQNANWTGIRRENIDNRKDLNQNGVDLDSSECRDRLQTSTDLQEMTVKVENISHKLRCLVQRDPLSSQGVRILDNNEDDCIGVCERDSAVTSIKTMQRFYSYGSDTLMAAISYMDKFLLKVKVKKRYMSCVAAASFYLAAKMFEEPEDVPTASELSNLHRKCWKPSDLKRMEKVILDKFSWDMYPIANCLSFLDLIYPLLQLVEPAISLSFYETLSNRAELYINYSKCANYRASTLAMSIIHQCLKTAGYNSMALYSMLLHVQTICKVSDSELFDCQCTLSEQLEVYTRQPASRPLALPLPKLMPRLNLVFRPSLYGSTDLPTIAEVPVDEHNTQDEVEEDEVFEEPEDFSDEEEAIGSSSDEEMQCESMDPACSESTDAQDCSDDWSCLSTGVDPSGSQKTRPKSISTPFLYSEVVSLGRAAFAQKHRVHSASSGYLSSHCHTEEIGATSNIPMCNIIKA